MVTSFRSFHLIMNNLASLFGICIRGLKLPYRNTLSLLEKSKHVLECTREATGIGSLPQANSYG